MLSIDPVFLTAVQGLRIFGGAFLFLYAFGHLPALFAMPAGWGDVLVAVLAPFVVALLAANRDFLKSNRLLAFHLLGLLDFVGAIAARHSISVADLRGDGSYERFNARTWLVAGN